MGETSDMDMKSNSSKGIHREMVMKWLEWIFGIVIFVVFFYFLLGEMFLPKENDAYFDQYRVLDIPWCQVWEDGTRTPIEIPGVCEVERGEAAVIEAVLPMDIDYKEYLCLRGTQQDVRVYIDGELRSEYSTKDTRPFGKNSPNGYVFAMVTNEDEGKTVRVEIVSDSTYSGMVDTIYIGERMSIWSEFIEENGLQVVLAGFMIVLGIISIIVSVLLRNFYDKNIMLEYLGWSIVLAAVWIISESRLRQIFFPNITVVSSMVDITIMLIAFPIVIYMNSIQKKRYQTAYVAIAVATLANAVIAVILQLMNKMDFAETIWMAHAVIIASSMIIALTVIKDIQKKYIGEYRHVAIGLLAFLITGVIEIVRSYAPNYTMAGIFVSIGLLLLLTSACVKTGNDIISREREKQRMLLSQATQVGFLAYMSHEIRTPLNTVVGMNEMILREDTSEVVRRYATNIKIAGKTLEALISDVLDFSKIQSGGFDMEDASYDLASFVNDSIHILKASVEHKKLEANYNIDENMPSVLKGDEIRIKRVLNILMENAVKHTEKGCITLSFQGDVNDEGLFILTMAVADTGKGIQKEKMEGLFDHFEALSKGREADSIGLGLDIVKRFVEQMGGEIKVDSLYGKGSLFTVKIPQEIVNDDPIGDIHDEYKRECAAENTVRERLYAPDTSMLVVDDNEMNLQVVKGMLKRSGIYLEFATGGQESVLLCRKRKYDLILMDHMMPAPDGIETLHLIHNDAEGLNRDTKIIVLTANAISGIKEKYLAEGFSDYMSKPIDVEKLEKTLYLHLAGKASFLFEEKPEEKKEEKVETVEIEMSGKKHIDRQLGLRYCADDEEMYQEIMEAYYEQGEEYCNILAAAYETKDWQTYAVKTHALKSSSLTIGAAEFSELAKKHEFAGKEKNEALIQEEYEYLIAFYKEILEEVKTMCGITDKVSAEETVKGSEYVEAEEYRQLGRQLLTHIQAYEMNEALELIENMLSKSASGEKSEETVCRTECLTQAQEAVNEFDYEKAEELVTTWLNG